MNSIRKTREERVQEIWKAAKMAFLDSGFSSTTMEDIIRRTGLSKGGFYHYYGNKKDILMDMMRHGNHMYMNFNPFMLKLKPSLPNKEKIQIVMEAILDKCLDVTGDKRIYTMFVYEAMYDVEIWKLYLELERDFLVYICSKLGDSHIPDSDNFVFISRMISAVLSFQHISNEPEFLMEKRQEIKEMMQPSLEKIFKDFNEVPL